MCYNFDKEKCVMKKLWILPVVCLLGACATLKTSPELIARGNGYLTDGNAKQAIYYFNKAVTVNPKNMDAYVARATAYFINAQYKEAAADFATAINANPNNSSLYISYAAAAAASEDYPNALKALEMAQKINAERPEIYFSRGNIYFLLGHYDLAIQDFSAVINAYPAAEVFNARAAALIKQGKTDTAREDLAAARSGKYPETLNEYARAQ